MAQAKATLVVNLLPSSSSSTVADLSDELLLLLEAAAEEIGVVVDKTIEIVIDDEVVAPVDAEPVDDEEVKQEVEQAMLLAEAFAISKER